MDVIIAFGVSIAGSLLTGTDFCTLFTFTSIATALLKYAYDKTANRQIMHFRKKPDTTLDKYTLDKQLVKV